MDRVARLPTVHPHPSASSFYETTAVGLVLGSASMTHIVVGVRNNIPHQAAQQEVSGNVAGGNGFALVVAGGTRVLEFLVTDGGGVVRIPTPTYAFPLGSEVAGRTFVAAMSHDGVNAIWNLNNSVTGTIGCVGYTANPTRFGILARGGLGTSQTRVLDVAGVLHTDSQALNAAALAAAVAQVMENVEQGRDLDSGLAALATPLAPEHYWDAADIVVGTPAAARASWPDRIGALNLTRNGAVQSGFDYPGRPV